MSRIDDDDESYARAYCQCWSKTSRENSKSLGSSCTCGEENPIIEWRWEQPHENVASLIVMSEDNKQVTFHPNRSNGTAAVRGDTPLLHNYHYYWEVKMLTETFGTDIMVGVGTSKINISESLLQFKSLLGQDTESYGLSYTGMVRHNGRRAWDSPGFCRGSIIGVRLDMWKGMLEFYINRKSQGISFYNLRRHDSLYPIICSTAVQSSMRLIYAASWRASLFVDAAKVLASKVKEEVIVPSGVWYTLQRHFWLTLPTETSFLDDNEENDETVPILEQVNSVRIISNFNQIFVPYIDNNFSPYE